MEIMGSEGKDAKGRGAKNMRSKEKDELTNVTRKCHSKT